MDQNLSKQGIGTTLSWIFGVMLSFFGFAGLMASDFIPGLVLFLMGLVLLPPIGKLSETKWNFRLTALRKTMILIVGFFIFVFSIGSSDTTKTQIAEQKNEVKSERSASQAPVETVAAPELVKEDASNANQSDDAQKKLYPVKKVVDGDTIQVTIDGKDEVLRLIGINTPETVDPRTPVQCFGIEASNKAKEALTGKNVGLEADETQSERDKYGRLLRYVYLEDGTNFNKMMIEEGYAYEYTYGTPYKYQADFKTAQQQAKDAKRGLWAEDTCNGELTKSTTNTVKTTTTTQVTTQTPTKTETPTQSSGSFACTGKHLCGQMASCQEAYFYLNTCGVGSLDRDKDGIPCETLCN